jgi:hypothetical protein
MAYKRVSTKAPPPSNIGTDVTDVTDVDILIWLFRVLVLWRRRWTSTTTLGWGWGRFQLVTSVMSVASVPTSVTGGAFARTPIRAGQSVFDHSTIVRYYNWIGPIQPPWSGGQRIRLARGRSAVRIQRSAYNFHFSFSSCHCPRNVRDEWMIDSCNGQLKQEIGRITRTGIDLSTSKSSHTKKTKNVVILFYNVHYCNKNKDL